jgi:hypothetical protein
MKADAKCIIVLAFQFTCGTAILRKTTQFGVQRILDRRVEFLEVGTEHLFSPPLSLSGGYSRRCRCLGEGLANRCQAISVS